ncbi:AMP-binding protein [Micromonospora rifamycinica]|uniref:class I adenylate-forming enzyme family protein n=1 Tax=Micromonospora rifamycinica TaxID=291594 RepID=UPI0034316FE1
MLVHELFAQARAERPHHPAVIDGEGRLTYAELGRLVDRSVGWLRGQGVTAGQRVVYGGDADHRFLAFLYATLRLGAIFVPAHPELTGAQLGYLAGNCAATVVLHGAGPLAQAWQEVRETPPDPYVADTAPDDVALLIYTSGSTGDPKGVVCPHRPMVAAVGAVNARLGYRADDVVLCRLPLSFDYGLYQALLCATVGATLVLTARNRDAALLRLIEQHGITVVPLVPSLAQMLTVLQRRRKVPTRIRLFTNTGARLGRDTVAELLDCFPGAAYASMYGMTECKRISILDPAEYADHPDSVGPAIPGDVIRIVDADKRAVPPGTVGEIVVRGATVMAGYWQIPMDQQQRYLRGPDGALELHTGDQGYLDQQGRLYFVGRDDDMIKRRGVRMSLTEVENAAERVAGIVAAVALRPAADDAPLVLAVLSELTEPELRDLLAEHLDRARMPDRITHLDEVPLTPNGKPDRKAVERLLRPESSPQKWQTHEPVAV